MTPFNAFLILFLGASGLILGTAFSLALCYWVQEGYRAWRRREEAHGQYERANAVPVSAPPPSRETIRPSGGAGEVDPGRTAPDVSGARVRVGRKSTP